MMQNETRAKCLDTISLKTTKSGSLFSEFPTVLISEIASYLQQTDRIHLSRINLLLAKAASTSAVMTHLLVNRYFKDREMETELSKGYWVDTRPRSNQELEARCGIKKCERRHQSSLHWDVQPRTSTRECLHGIAQSFDHGTAKMKWFQGQDGVRNCVGQQ